MKQSDQPAEKVLREIEQIGQRSWIPSIGPVKGKILAEVVGKYKPKRILEVGALYGYSAILIAKNAPNAEVITIEKSPENARITAENIKRASLSDRIQVKQGDAAELLPTLSGTFDLLFLDADKTQYLKNLQDIEQHLPKGAVVVADNVGIFKDQLQDYLEYVRKSGMYKSRTVETLLEFSITSEDAMEISEKVQ